MFLRTGVRMFGEKAQAESPPAGWCPQGAFSTWGWLIRRQAERRHGMASRIGHEKNFNFFSDTLLRTPPRFDTIDAVNGATAPQPNNRTRKEQNNETGKWCLCDRVGYFHSNIYSVCGDETCGEDCRRDWYDRFDFWMMMPSTARKGTTKPTKQERNRR